MMHEESLLATYISSLEVMSREDGLCVAASMYISNIAAPHPNPITAPTVAPACTKAETQGHYSCLIMTTQVIRLG